MTFQIEQTSCCFYEDKPPCKNAYIKETVICIPVLRFENGKPIKGDPIIRKRWFVDINTLEELIALREEVENPLIVDHDDEMNKDTIEIYDDYRE